MSFHALDRRTFLETTATMAAASFLTSRLGWAAGEHKINKVGVQLYNVRNQADFDNATAKVAQIGYKEVELAGYFGRGRARDWFVLPPVQLVRAALDKNGLSALSTHMHYDEIDEKFPSIVEDSKIIGLKYIVCPWSPEEARKSFDALKEAAERFNRCGEQAKKVGIQFAYYNQWFEFLPVDGKIPYDELLKLCDANLVKMEMDLCWITAAGADPLKYFNMYPGRFPLVHVKDLKKLPAVSSGGSQNLGDAVDLTAVGSGIIDWKKIFAQSDKAGIKHYIVEYDNPKDQSIAESYDYLSKLRW